MLVLKIGAIHVQGRKFWQPSEVGGGKEHIPSENLQKEGGSVNTPDFVPVMMIWDFSASGINFCSLKESSLCNFVTVATGS